MYFGIHMLEINIDSLSTQQNNLIQLKSIGSIIDKLLITVERKPTTAYLQIYT
jgi:hypothetical protein